MIISGGCRCGAVRYSIDAEPRRLAIPSGARLPRKKRKAKGPLSRNRFRLSVTPRPFQPSITPRPLQLSVKPRKFQISVTPRPFRPSVTRAPSAFRNTQPVSSRSRRTGAATKWQACCSEHSAATEEIASAYGALRTFHEENRHCNSNEQGGGFTTAIRTRGSPCATSSAKPGGGRRIHAVRKRSGRFNW